MERARRGDEVNRFWMVYCDARKQSPTVKHFTLEAAEEEAQRLARKHPGDIFAILCSVGGFKSEIAEPEFHLPFINPNLALVGKEVDVLDPCPFADAGDSLAGVVISFNPDTEKVCVAIGDAEVQEFALDQIVNVGGQVFAGGPE
jgi:hypothetical protein